MRLIDAKCPNCGANIEVNKDEKKGICQFCGGTVIIDDAIEKYKLEVSGKVEIDGIKGRKDFLKQAKNHFKVGEYDEARTFLLKLIGDDKFDIESYILLVKTNIELLEESDFDETTSEYVDRVNWGLAREVVEYKKRIEKIDDGNTHDEDFQDYEKQLKHYTELIEKREEEDKYLSGLVKKLNDYLDKTMAVESACAESWCDWIQESLGLKGLWQISYKERTATGYSRYRINKFKKISRDGYVESRYTRLKDNEIGNPNSENLYPYRNDEKMTFEDIKEWGDTVDEFTEAYLSESKGHRNKAIDKENAKITRQNAVSSATSGVKYILIGVLVLWIVSFVGSTLSLFLSGHPVQGILMIVLIDSWLVGYPIKWVISMWDSIKYAKTHKKQHKDHV